MKRNHTHSAQTRHELATVIKQQQRNISTSGNAPAYRTCCSRVSHHLCTCSRCSQLDLHVMMRGVYASMPGTLGTASGVGCAQRLEWGLHDGQYSWSCSYDGVPDMFAYRLLLDLFDSRLGTLRIIVF